MVQARQDAAGERVGRAYDALADAYVERFGRLDALAPQDRALVTRWRGSVAGPLLDAGCGPGVWTAHLAARGRPVLGVDLSARFLAHARRTHPDVAFARASLAALPLRDASVGGVLVWFSTIHLEPARLPVVLAELRRVLAPGGRLLLGYADGPPGLAYDHAVTTAWFTSLEALVELLAPLGLTVVEHEARQDEGARPVAALVARVDPPRP